MPTDAQRAYQRAWYHKNIEKCREGQRSARLKRKYGMTLDGYNALVEEQDGRCAICRQVCELGHLQVDHDHTNGQVRGLLCHKCNKMLGLACDSPSLLEAATRYLRG